VNFMKLKNMYSFLDNDINVIEQELETIILSQNPLLKQAYLHLLQAGGKRIRPVFVLLSGKFGQYEIDKIKYVAVALELIHMASLVHDDVIDDAELRRGKPTIKAKWDNRIAMYTGDYIFARSIELMAKLDNSLAHQTLSKTIVEVCIGEIEQIKDKYNFEQNLRTYLRRIKRKTALLIAVSCQLGAISSNSSEEIHKRLFQFGYFVGMAYQIIDDILDFTGTEKQLGKPAGGDLLQGNITLPVLYAMVDPEFRSEITTINFESDSDKAQMIIDKVRLSDAIEKSYDLSNRYLQKAFQVLEKLPSSKAKTTLYNIAKYLGKRKY
jgi:heptaprenyl diphosphate synthase